RAGIERPVTPMFLFIAFLIFTASLAAAGYYVWSVPRQEQHEIFAGRLRGWGASGGARVRRSSDLIKSEQRGRLGPIGDFVAWIGILRRLQEYITQANLKYRAADVFALSLIIAVVA